MGKKANYGYTIQRGTDPTLADQSGDSFKDGYNAELIVANQPDRKSMRYLGKGDEENFDVTNAGAGRGKQGGPTAKQADANRAMMSPAERGARDDQDFEKYSKVRPEQKYKKGGSVSSASKRGDGIAQRGKTKGKFL